jgi:hypothetical protein
MSADEDLVAEIERVARDLKDLAARLIVQVEQAEVKVEEVQDEQNGRRDEHEG